MTLTTDITNEFRGLEEVDLARAAPNSKNESKTALYMEGVGYLCLHGDQRQSAEECKICARQYQIIRDAHPGWHAYCLECLSQFKNGCPECRCPLPSYHRAELGPDFRSLHVQEDRTNFELSERQQLLWAVCLDPSILTTLDPIWRNDRDFLLDALIYNSLVLHHAPSELLDDDEFILQGIEICSSVFLAASPRLQEDRGFLMRAIETNSNIILHSPSLQDDEEAIYNGAKKDSRVFSLASGRLQSNREFSMNVLRANPDVFPYLAREFLYDAIQILNEL